MTDNDHDANEPEQQQQQQRPQAALAKALFANPAAPTHAAALAAMPKEEVQALWKEVKLLPKEEEEVPCKVMYPLVRSSCWSSVDSLDLIDAGRWLTDASLLAIACVPNLQSLKLTACKHLTDEGVAAFAERLRQEQLQLRLPSQMALTSLDLSWCEQISDAALTAALPRLAPTLTSLNLTGLTRLTDQAIPPILQCTKLERLSLACCTSLTDTALDYLTYYSRLTPEQRASLGQGGGTAAASGTSGTTPSSLGCDGLKRLELSGTRFTDTGVGKLVAVIEDGKPFGKVFKSLEYLGLSSTQYLTPTGFRQVQIKYSLSAPLPNAQKTLAKSNGVALDAQGWVLRLPPDETRARPPIQRTWEGERIFAYVAQFTHEMAASVEVIRRLVEADRGGPPMNPQAEAKRPRHS